MMDCAAVSVHFVVNDQTAKTFTSGTTMITGLLVVEDSANGQHHAEHFWPSDGDYV